MSKQRIVCWFSCGAASAVATKLTVNKYLNGDFPDCELVIASIYLKNEHEDSHRFLKECEDWFCYPITILKDEKYNADVDTVIEKTRYMSGVMGARCTKELKKQVRLDWQRHDDIHVFGMTIEEEHRIDRLLDTEPSLEIYSPLIEYQLKKEDCFTFLNSANIELPAMYKLGYHNNNCIGCLKATGAGYWNKIRKDFPEVFARRAEQERMLGLAGMCKVSEKKLKKEYSKYYEKMKKDHNDGLCKWQCTAGSLRIPLRYLPPDMGKHSDLNIGACGFFCELIE